MRRRVTIANGDTAVFSMPDGTILYASVDEDGLCVFAQRDADSMRPAIYFEGTHGNGGIIKSRLLPPIKTVPLKRR
jgi:hypothetical protein